MKTTKRIEITVETDEVWVIRRLGSPISAWCVECGAPVQMVRVEEAVRLTGLSWREIARRVESGRVHFSETAEGLLWVCLQSLSAGE